MLSLAHYVIDLFFLQPPRDSRQRHTLQKNGGLYSFLLSVILADEFPVSGLQRGYVLTL